MNSAEETKLITLEKIIGYKFKDKSLLLNAITHSSFSNDFPVNKSENYERLEFLGDTVFNCIITEYLYNCSHNQSEGEMTKRRAVIICEQSLYSVCSKYGILEYIRTGNCLRSENGINVSIGADVVEAIIASIFLDSGFETARRIVLEMFSDILNGSENTGELTDYKSNLQEYLQKKFQILPRYETNGMSGPVHDRTYHVNVFVHDKVFGEGSAKSKKEAEQISARNALIKLGIINEK